MLSADEFEFLPLLGANSLLFGMTYDEVVAVLGEPEQHLARLWGSEAKRAGWRSGGLSIHFNPALVFIEISRDTGLTVKLAGIDLDLLQTPADQVLKALETRGYRARSEGPKPGYTFVFRDLEFALWRQFVPESAEDPEGRYFDVAALGQRGYFE